MDPHWTPLGPFIGLLDPTPQGSRALLFDFLFLINGAPNHPLPTGTLKQSYATAANSDSYTIFSKSFTTHTHHTHTHTHKNPLPIHPAGLYLLDKTYYLMIRGNEPRL